jgi:hypothetical protein
LVEIWYQYGTQNIKDMFALHRKELNLAHQ